MSARFLLRDETRAAHEALDAYFSGFDLGDKDDYRAFLRAHAAAFIPVEEALDDAGAGDIFPMWPEMRRAALLENDLEAIGSTVPTANAAPQLFETSAEIIGALYVLEGSRLGGKILQKQVGDELPRAFLSQHAAIEWPQFVSQIEHMLEADVDRTRAVASANRVFEYFLRAAKADESGGA